tara:strand:- start:62 stop:214 length:153 start_codon:yes stop_codon:yes gene_type:complete
MNSISRQSLNLIKTKLKDPVTGQKRFKNDDQVIDLALENLMTRLKEQRLL